MDQLKQPKQEMDFNEPVKDTRQELDFNKPVKDTRPEMDFDSDKKPMQPKQEEKPLDRYGNPIDKNNLDLYDDEDIYETDEKGFVLLPKKLKKGLEKESKPQAQQKTLPEPSIRNLNDDESKKIYQMYKNGQTREDLMGYLRKKAIQDNEEESYNDMDASDYLESIITPQIDLKSDYLDKLYDYYGGDAEKIVDELGKYNISENPYVLDNMIRNFVAQKQGKGLLPRLNSLSFNKPLKDFQMENVLDRYGGDPRMAALYFNQFNNKDLTDEDVQNSLNEFYKRYESFDATKSSAYRNQPNEQIRDAFNFLHDNIYENRNFGLGTESELAFKNIDKIEQYINQLKQIKPRNRYERSDLENVLGQLEEMRDKGLEANSTENNSQELNQELTNKIFEQAKDTFGTTNNFNAAFYLLPDGTMLDGSGFKHGSGQRRNRTMDHRDIGEVYRKLNIDLPEDRNTNYPEFEDFLKKGAIRIMPETNSLEVNGQLTDAQKQKIGELYQQGWIEALEVNGEYYDDLKSYQQVMNLLR